MKYLVVTDADWGECEIEQASLGADFAVSILNTSDPDEIVDRAQHAHALLVQRAVISDSVLRRLPNLKVVVRYGIGIDNVDVDAAARRGVTVTGVPDYCIREVAEHTAMFVSLYSRRTSQFTEQVQNGSWGFRSGSTPHLPPDDPVGVVGAGRIGRAVIDRLVRVGHPVFAFDPYAPERALPAGSARAESLEALASEVNHMTLHVPLVEETRAFIDEDILRTLGPEGHLINTSRGGLVDEAALLRVLDDDGLGHASLDVLGVEPPGEGHRALIEHRRTTVTPHIAYLSSQSLATLRQRAAHLARDLLAPTSTTRAGSNPP